MSPRFTIDPDGYPIKKITNPARLEAQASGYKHYVGGSCRSCCDDTARRYVSTGQCVACVLRRSKARNRTPRARAWRRQWANTRNAINSAMAHRNDDLK